MEGMYLLKVLKDLHLLEVLGVAGELLTVDGHVVAAVDLGGDADLRQRGDHRAAEQAEIAGLFAQACITETPAFDSYTEEYAWDGYHVPKAINSL